MWKYIYIYIIYIYIHIYDLQRSLEMKKIKKNLWLKFKDTLGDLNFCIILIWYPWPTHLCEIIGGQKEVKFEKWHICQCEFSYDIPGLLGLWHFNSRRHQRSLEVTGGQKEVTFGKCPKEPNCWHLCSYTSLTDIV